MRKALQEADGSRAEASRLLGVTPRTLRYLLSKYRTRTDMPLENN